MAKKSRKDGQQQQLTKEQQQQQSQMLKQQQMMEKMNYYYEQSNLESMNQPPGPLDVLLSATPALLLGAFSVSTFCRWYFKDSKPISQQKLIDVLNSAYRTWTYVLSEFSKQEQTIMQQNPDMTPDQKRDLTQHLRMQLLQQLTQAEEQLLQESGTDREQIQAAIKAYEGQKQVSQLVNQLTKIVNTVVPPPPLPYPWTENDVLAILSQLFEIRISSMEEAYRALQFDQRPKGVPLTPQMTQDLNELFTETLQRRIDAFHKERKSTAQLVAKLTRSLTNSPSYVDLVQSSKQEQQQRYAALGLEIRTRN